MEMKAKNILKQNNQEHIINWMEKVDEKTKNTIVEQVLNIDFDELKYLYKNVGVFEQKKDVETIKSLNTCVMSQEEKQEYIDLGEKVIRNNQFAAMTLAGGQGTRLGHNGPKGSFKIDLGENGKYLFELIIDKLICENKKYNITIPYYIMTSRENHKETVDFFEKMNYFGYPKTHVYFFMQEEEPLINKQGKLLISEEKIIRLASNGNGEVFKSMRKKGIIDDMRAKGIKWLTMTGVDNILVKLVDPILIGAAIKKNTQIASKAIIKRNATEGGGVFARWNGKPGIIEYVEVPADIANSKDENGEFIFGDMNILNHLFTLDAVEKISNSYMPYHTAVKKAKYLDENGKIQEDKVYKFEKFVFDGFIYFDDIAVVRVKREEEFAPIKNPDGQDSPETAIKLYKDYMKTLKKQ